MIKCTTNLDNYTSSMFPNLNFVPRVGEFVKVKKNYHNLLRSKKLPFRLEVVGVTYDEDKVTVELWYNATDKKIIDLNQKRL